MDTSLRSVWQKSQYDTTRQYDKGFVGMTKIYKYDKEFVILSLL